MVVTIKISTVRYHVGQIYEKLHVHSRTEATLKYLGKKSDTARLAGDTLAEALAQRSGYFSPSLAPNANANVGIGSNWGEQELGLAATGQTCWLSQGHEELGDVPGCREGACFGLTIAHYGSYDQLGVIESCPTGVGQHVP